MNVAGLEATRRAIVEAPLWRIPDMKRRLVEAATHPQALERINAEMGWEHYARRLTGKALTELGAGRRVTLDRADGSPEGFPDAEERIRTRLGGEGVVLTFQDPPRGPFGAAITRLALPAHWSLGMRGDETPEATSASEELLITIGERRFFYDRSGLQILKIDP